MAIGLLLPFSFIYAENSQIFASIFAVNVPYERHHYRKECSDFSEDVKRFSDKLNEKNLKIFCEEFDDAKRAQAMQMAEQKGITPDQAVERAAKK